MLLSPSPQYPFQQICADYFENEGHTYLTIVDIFSYWLNICHIPRAATSDSLIAELRRLLASYGVSEELSSDGGPQFTSNALQQFLKDWGVKFRLSSANYPQSNGRAELAVKTAKRIIQENTTHGTLNNDKVIRALLQYRNTPLPHIGLSRAQILLHQQLREHVPSDPQYYRLHKQWLVAAKQRENALSHRNENLVAKHNLSAHELPPLNIGENVAIHDPHIRGKKRWVRTGTVIEVQYWKNVV